MTDETKQNEATDMVTKLAQDQFAAGALAGLKMAADMADQYVDVTMREGARKAAREAGDLVASPLLRAMTSGADGLRRVLRETVQANEARAAAGE